MYSFYYITIQGISSNAYYSKSDNLRVLMELKTNRHKKVVMKRLCNTYKKNLGF